jgi:hypothetical protein
MCMWVCFFIYIFFYLSSVCFLMIELFYSQSVRTDSKHVLQGGIKFNFSEFILIFDLVFGLYCSGQQSRQNKETKSYYQLTFDFFFMKDGNIGTVLSVCELIVNMWDDYHIGGSVICMSLCINNLNSFLIIPSCTRKRSLSCRHQWLVGPSIILPTRNVFKWWIFNN